MIHVVVGLGNIGQRYEGTRHNVGFDILNRVSERLRGSSMQNARHFAWRLVTVREGEAEWEVKLVWPTTLMNRSGWAFETMLSEWSVAPTECLVVVDDFNLPLGALRFRERGSDGGHNGLASIIETIETDDFPRLRLGIGPLADKDRVTEFVLGRFEADEAALARKMIDFGAEATLFAITHRLAEAMSRYNGTVDEADETETSS